jgi:TonB family protein
MFAFLPVSAGTGVQQSWPSRITSVALHAALIAAAVRLSEAREAPEVYRPTIVDIAPPPSPGHQAPPPAPVPDGSIGRDPLILSSVIPDYIPEPGDVPDIPVHTDPGLTFTTGDSLPLTGGNLVIGVAPIDARLADESPRLLNHPPVRYPEIMRQAGLESRVVVETVLDTMGRAEPGSLRVVVSGGPAFDDEARAVVAGSRYAAARLSGRAVRVRIQVPVVFALRP